MISPQKPSSEPLPTSLTTRINLKRRIHIESSRFLDCETVFLSLEKRG